MSDAFEKVKALAADYGRWSTESARIGDKAKSGRQFQISQYLQEVVGELDAARKRLRPIPSDYGDLSDLPSEVLAQLNLAKVDELEQQMRDIVAAGDGAEIGIDQIIIELYRRHKVIQERRFIMNKLYRMAQKGIINNVEGKKGVYYLPKTTWGTGWGERRELAEDLDDDIPF